MGFKDKVVSIGEARKRSKTDSSLEELLNADLARSGITPDVAAKLKIQALDAEETWAKLHPKNPNSMPRDFTAETAWFPYWNADGTVMNYGRARILRGQWSKTDNGKRNRYRNPVNTLPHIYLPVPILDWQHHKKTKRFIVPGPLAITEGEKKAITAALHDIPCISIGGINSEGSQRHGIILLDEFDWFDWPDIDAEVCYDSDVYGAKAGSAAMYAIGYTLRREKHPKSISYVRFRTENHAKTALDDFLVSYPKKTARAAYYEVPRSLDEIDEAFSKFDSEVVFVRDKARFYSLVTRIFYEGRHKLLDEYGVGNTVISADGQKRVLPITLWPTERDPARTTVMSVVFEPGKPPRYRAEPGDEHETLNEWRPTTLIPTPYNGKPHSVRPWLDFIEYMTPALTDEQRDWFINWQAYPIQNLGGKLRQAVLVWSTAQGAGKNTLAEVLFPMYGRANLNWQSINGSTLIDNFNDWALRQFVMVNEVHMPSYGEQKAVMESLKTLITEEVIDHRRMYVGRQNVRNYVNLMLASNDEAALRLEDDDRRFFVIRGPSVKDKWTDAQFRQFYDWLNTGGREKVFGYLLARPLADFNPFGAAPRTEARSRMVRVTDNVLGDLVEILFTSPMQILASRRRDDTIKERGKWDLYTPTRLIEAMHAYAQEKHLRVFNLTSKSLGAVMSKHKFVRRRLEIKGVMITVYALFDTAKWKQRTNDEWRNHIKEQLQ